MNWVVFLCFLSVQQCIGGAPYAVTRFAVVDTLGRILLTYDVCQPRQLARMSHRLVDPVSTSRFACILHNGMHEITISASAA